MSNEAARHAREYLDLIKWSDGQITWEAVTIKMLDGGNQVIEKSCEVWKPGAQVSEPSRERRICGNLDSHELAIFIACAPSALSNAAHAIENLERDIESLKKEHEGNIYESNRKSNDWKQKYDILKGVVENQTNEITKLQKKLSRHEKKRVKKK